MSQKQKNRPGGIVGTILGILVVVIGAIVYAVTGVDFLGVTTPDATSEPVPITRVVSGNIQPIEVGLGLGAQKDFWQVYFTAPSNTRDRSQYTNGVDVQLARAIDSVRNTLDIAAFELNNETITEAIFNAHERGVRVRIVTDDEHGLEDDDSTLVELELAGVPIVDDDRSALMHNKFMLMDGATVWMGSMNYTVNGVYRNNNNVLVLRSVRAVEAYQAEFDEMFERGEFGPRSSENNTGNFTQNGVPIEVYFASENEVVDEIIAEINRAQRNIRFMSFSFTRDDIGAALLGRAAAGVDVQGVFENTGSVTQFSELPRLFCAGIDVRQDGNNGILHHKVFVIDEQVVITGSFNFSNNAVESNDENVVIIRDPDLAALYLEEFGRVQRIAERPTNEETDCR